MTANEYHRLENYIIDALDRTMPGRRIGSTPPPDYMVQAATDVERLTGVLPEPSDADPCALGMTAMREFCREHGLLCEDAYVRAFRSAAIKHRMREECGG